MLQASSEPDYYPLFARHVHSLTEHGPEVRGCCPFHDDHTPSWTGNRHTGMWKCFGCGLQGNAYQFAERVGETREMERAITATYPYHDEHGGLLLEVVRFDPKDFRQRRPAGNGGWLWNLNGTRRVLYHLPEILDKQTIFLPEGEKDADRLWSLGLPATTCPGGAGKWRPEYSQCLAGKRVVILQDNDEVGEQHAQDVARSLLSVAAAVKIVRLPGLPQKGNVSDWLDGGKTKEDLAAIVRATPILKAEDLTGAPSEDQSKTVLTQLSDVTPAPEPWPVLGEDALYGLAGDIVKAIDPYTEADPVSTLLNVLAGFGNCIGAAAHATVQHDPHPARLFIVQVGDTSKGRKGTGWSTPRYLFSLCDPDWKKDRVKSGLSSGEGLIYNVRDPVWKKEPIKEKGRVVDYQDVMVDSGESDKRLLIVEPEFASTLTVMAREGNILSAVIRQAWDNGDLSPLTKSNPIKATGAHCSLICHITKDELLIRLDDTSRGNGFANRFLWAVVRRSKELPEGGTVPEEALQPLAERLSTVITFSRTVSEIKRDDEAKALWASAYHDLSEGKPGLLGAVLSRAEAQVLRLSVIYALLDSSSLVKVEHLRAALALWEYCERSAVLIFGKRLGDSTADRILEALRTAGPSGMSDNDIVEMFGRNKSANELARAKSVLARLGLATSAKQPPAEGGKRPRTVWVATS